MKEYELCQCNEVFTFQGHSPISSAVMLSDLSVHSSIELMVMCMPAISLSLPILWLCLDNQSAINSGSVLGYIVF